MALNGAVQLAPEVDCYLTDGAFLYRVAGHIARGEQLIVDLEDCYRLDVVRIPAARLRERRLRVVTPGPS